MKPNSPKCKIHQDPLLDHHDHADQDYMYTYAHGANGLFRGIQIVTHDTERPTQHFSRTSTCPGRLGYVVEPTPVRTVHKAQSFWEEPHENPATQHGGEKGCVERIPEQKKM